MGSLAYSVICHAAGLKLDYSDKPPTDDVKVEGGHQIFPRWNKVKGNIVSIDFASAYPHALIMANLYSHSCECCKKEFDYGLWVCGQGA